MPKNPKDYALYKDYYLNRESSAAGKKKRVQRAQARAAAIKSGALTGKSDPREVDHKRPLSKGGGNGKGNVRVISRTANREKFDR